MKGLVAAVLLLATWSGAGPAQEPSPAKAEADRRFAGRDDALRLELLAMMEQDQAARRAMMQAIGEPGDRKSANNPSNRRVLDELKQVDDRNRARLRAIVEARGWPGKSLVGDDGAHAAWLIVQHADSDRAFQKACLRRMQSAPSGEVAPTDIAYLTDRVLVGEKKPQRYGTQLDGDLKPFPIEDETHVDDRRKAMGMPPLAEYLKFAREATAKMRGKM